uniref:Uncharacterized protein n=1 Tax=Triticum urartu TaxID=4572 RepID=A0A8R7P8H4_TRIUA
MLESLGSSSSRGNQIYYRSANAG